MAELDWNGTHQLLSGEGRRSMSAVGRGPGPGSNRNPRSKLTELSQRMRLMCDSAGIAATLLTSEQYSQFGFDDVLSYEMARYTAADLGLCEYPVEVECHTRRVLEGLECVAVVYRLIAESMQTQLIAQEPATNK